MCISKQLHILYRMVATHDFKPRRCGNEQIAVCHNNVIDRNARQQEVIIFI